MSSEPSSATDTAVAHAADGAATARAGGTKIIVGQGDALQAAMAAWAELDPSLKLVPAEVSQDGIYAFDLSKVEGLAPAADVTAFVAWSEQFMNLRRFELMGEMKSKGFAMPALIEKGALVAPTARIGENGHVGRGAIVGHGTVVAHNAVIGAGAVVGDFNRLGHSTWIAAGAQTGRRVKLGSNVTLGTGVIVSDDVDIGRFCVVDRPGRLTTSLAPKTFLLSTFDQPVVIVG